MKRNLIKISVIAVLFSALVLDASAQGRRGGRRGGNPPANEQQQNNNNNPPANYPTNGNIPIRVDSSGLGGSLDTTFRRTLRWDGAFAPDTSTTMIPLDYEYLRKDDALFSERVWRELDLREKMNQVFRYNAQDDNGDQKFIAILLNAVRKGRVLAFSDDRFTQPLDMAGVQTAMGGGAGADTNKVTDPNDPSKIIEYVVTPKTFNTNDVMKLRIKEQWIFDRETSRMFARIIGICPLKTSYFEGTKKKGC